VHVLVLTIEMRGCYQGPDIKLMQSYLHRKTYQGQAQNPGWRLQKHLMCS